MIYCKNCQNTFNGNFCNHCGQKNYTEKDKSVKHILFDAFHFLTHFEGTFFTTLTTVLFKPSVLTIDYCNGIRKKYFKPVSFFFFIIVLYLVFPLYRGLNLEMNEYKAIGFFGKKMEQEITNKHDAKNISFDELSKEFAYKSIITSKVCLFLFIPFSVLLLFLLFFTKRKNLFENIIYATEVNIFYVLTFFVIFPLLMIICYKLIGLFIPLNGNEIPDNNIIIFLNFLFMIYCSNSFKKYYKENWFLTSIKAVLFALLHGTFIHTFYKYIVFKLILIQL